MYGKYRKQSKGEYFFLIIILKFFEKNDRKVLRNNINIYLCRKEANMKKLSFLLSLFFLLSSCQSYKYGAGDEYAPSSNLTFGMVKSKIEKGKTSQAEILQIFGSPNMVTKNRSNNEVWSYNRMSVVQKGGQTNFLFGERASVSSSNKSFDLIIVFDSTDVVKDYSVISTNF